MASSNILVLTSLSLKRNIPFTFTKRFTPSYHDYLKFPYLPSKTILSQVCFVSNIQFYAIFVMNTVYFSIFSRILS